MLNGKVILITGGTGSFGKDFVKAVLTKYKPRKLIVFSRDELKQFEMQQYLTDPCLRFFIGDVRDHNRLMYAFRGVDYVVHAAALKQVPAMEYNPQECIKTNVLGAMNIIDAAISNNVKKVVALSTDKACNPVNLYGATKLCSDKLFTAAMVYASGTAFGVVRYGNVFGSRGSVIPFFRKCREKGVLPITHPEMTRFWITLRQGVNFVLESLEECEGGEVFVPKLPSMKITDLATTICPECEQQIVGIRPGEKIHESLINEDEARNSVEFENKYVVQTHAHLREVLVTRGGKPCQEGFSYTSKNNGQIMSTDELRLLLENYEDEGFPDQA